MKNQKNIVKKHTSKRSQNEIEKIFKRNLAVSFCCAFTGFIFLVFIPLVDINGNTVQTIGAYIVAILFWCSIIFEILFSYLCRKNRKLMEEKIYQGNFLQNSYSGIISFFKNKEAMITDIVLFVSVIAIVILFWTKAKNEWLIITGVSLFFLSFNMHCLLNGRNYRYYKAYSKKQRGA